MPQETPNLQLSVDLFCQLLSNSGGILSTRKLKKNLAENGIEEPELTNTVSALKFFDPEITPDIKMPFEWKHEGWNFYTIEEHRKWKQQQEKEAKQAEEIAAKAIEEEKPEEIIREKRQNRKEESRMGTYVADALLTLYESDCCPEDAEYVFDVHSEHGGSEYENVDVLAVHWRSEKVVDLVSVEVKQDFTTKLIQQAGNYLRFSHRVWIAVPVSISKNEAVLASKAIRDQNPVLFDHAVDLGLGILACRKGPGGSYDVFPVHWPKRNVPDPMELNLFTDRYREHLIEAGVVPEKQQVEYPVL